MTVALDTQKHRDKYHGMAKQPSQIVTHQAWTPADLERLSGLTPVNLRDLRRRKLAPETERGQMSLTAAAQLFLQSKLVAHGFGPKSVKELAETYAKHVIHHALKEEASWADSTSYTLWKTRVSDTPEFAYLALVGEARRARPLKCITEISDIGDAVLTVVNLQALGIELSAHIAQRPSSAMVIGSGGSNDRSK